MVSNSRWKFCALSFVLLCVSAGALAQNCSALPSDPKPFLVAALNEFATSSRGLEAQAAEAECAYRHAKHVDSRFDEFYIQHPDSTVRLFREATDIQRAAQTFAAQMGDPTAEGVFFEHERELRRIAIDRLGSLEKPPISEMIRHHASLVAILAIRGKAEEVVQTVIGATSTSWLDAETRFVYLKSVASCPAWDVTSAERMDGIILGDRLKAPQCAEAATDALELLCKPGARSQKIESLLRKFAVAGKTCK